MIPACPKTVLADCRSIYRIAGKFGEDFNLAVWRIVKNRQIKFSPIIKHDVIRNTHAHGLSSLALVSRLGLACQRLMAYNSASAHHSYSIVRKTFTFSLIDIVHCALY